MIRLIFTVFLFLGFFNAIVAQQTIVDTFNFDGYDRDYILYVPEIYDGNSAVPLVINLHGYGSNAQQQILYGDFRPLADEDNFIVVHPNGTFDLSNTRYWNAFANQGAVDDVAFIEKLIDTLSTQYNIDPNRVFSTGMSNGGFMSYKLACELSSKIKKIASVTGTMPTNLSSSCAAPPMPILQIHGTADATVPYNGNAGMTAIEDVIDFWVNLNQCNTTPEFTAFPDINTTDNCTAERYVYSGGTNNTEVILYKILNGGHSWPDAFITIPGYTTNRDINASKAIWEFFKGEEYTVGIQEIIAFDKDFSIQYKQGELTINTNSIFDNYGIYNLIGQEIAFSSNKTCRVILNKNETYILHLNVKGKSYSYQFNFQ